jgi:UDP-glucose 4-epimerase
VSPYGTSKLAAEEYLATWNRLYGSRHVALRLGNVYGPRQDPHGEAGVVAIFLAKIRDGQPATVFGDGSQTRDYVASADVVRAFVAAVGIDGGVFNVGTGVETSVLQLWQACLAATGKEADSVHAEPRLGELQRSVLDPARAARALGWRAELALPEGLRRTWEWLREE